MGVPQVSHVPYVPSLSRCKAASTSSNTRVD
jgi:hypothetical protein